MNKKYYRYGLISFSLFLLLCTSKPLSAQTESGNKEPFKPFHQLGLAIGHEHVFNGRDAEGNSKMLIVPFWGLDYNFHLSPKFALGVHTDFVVENFEVEKNLEGGPDDVVERSRPIAPALMGIWQPTEHWNFGLGVGGEFAKEEDYLLNRLAVEYGVEIRKGWEVAGSIQYDFRWNAYDTWTIGLGISKSFKKEK
ncbi:hypothetical protein [Flavihumibacter petaseus]|uniref:Outer membrane protein beta-barrel domain-containing protein n=1 Tax=Flavihumibacter petaseus NBRC 106054 TaxID=1220578 RepID=A0A0E9MVD5_9BACT|nr:hypothetical protein [Flavihumibacter petaseus]GAO41095.1 hypothetical protein FPE01S_01_01070 [Flavihumibacter petaseus NBRC 106054]